MSCPWIGFGGGAQRERTFGCPVDAHASLVSSWARPRGMGEWKRADLHRGPRGSSVAPGGALSLRGSSVAPGRATSGGARSPPGELGRPRGSSVALFCVGSCPGGGCNGSLILIFRLASAVNTPALEIEPLFHQKLSPGSTRSHQSPYCGPSRSNLIAPAGLSCGPSLETMFRAPPPSSLTA